MATATRKRRQRWTFTPDELSNPAACNGSDEFVYGTPSTDSAGNAGILVYRNGKASNRYADGVVGVSVEDLAHWRTESNPELIKAGAMMGGDHSTADEWRDVWAGPDGEFLGWRGTHGPSGAELTGRLSNDRPFAFTLTGDYAADLERAIDTEYPPDSAPNYSDIAAAVRAGYVYAAAHLFTGATETPLTDAVTRAYGGLPMGSDGWPKEWAKWVRWHKRNSKRCPHCESYVYQDEGDGDTCGNCAKSLKRP